MNLPVDQSARQQALDPTRSFIVQAPAGSGKTGLLIRRFLVLLARVDAPEEILAITFTRKATAEMRQRLICALRLENEKGEEEQDPELIALSTAAVENDRRHDWNLLTNTGRLRIQTIDSFCSELVHRMPWSARFGAAPVIVEDGSLLFTEAALRTLAHIEDSTDHLLQQSCGRLIELMDARLMAAATLLADMLARRDQWMRLGMRHSREQIEQWWQWTINDTLSACDELLDVNMRTELTTLAAFAGRNLSEQQEDNGKLVALRACKDMGAFPQAEWQWLDHWQGIACLLLTAPGASSSRGFRVRMDKRQGFPTTDKQTKARMSELLNSLQGHRELEQAMIRVSLLPPPKMQDSQWQLLRGILALLPTAAAELKLLFSETGQADYIELAQRAELALGEPDAPTDLALVFDNRLCHIMVDEFQDTSAGQITLLQKLIADWQQGDGNTAFFVGDPMQSIYRFREAEVANFLDVQTRGIAEIRPVTLLLQSNFRSDSAVIDWCNQTFSQVMAQHNDQILGAVKYAAATAFWSPMPDCHVQLHATVDAEDHQETETVTSLIRAELDRNDAQSIAVLGRTRRALLDIADALNLAAIPFQAVKLQTLGERQAIQDLLALTCALLQPVDRVAWLGVLRAPWCGLSLGDATLLCGDDHQRPLIELMQQPAALDLQSNESRARTVRVATIMARGLARQGRISLRQNVEATWLQLGGPAAIEPGDLDNCRRYLDLLQQLEQDQLYINNQSLAVALEKLWASTCSEARVQLLTIHASKGLEFDTVILPGLHRGTGTDKHTLLRLRNLPDRLLIAAKPPSTNRDDPFYRFLGELEKENQRNETTRQLYVACTRARRRLHLLGNVRSTSKDQLGKPAANSMLTHLWPVVEHAFKEAYDKRQTTDGDMVRKIELIDFPVERLPVGWSLPTLPDRVKTAGGTTPAEIGNNEIEFDWAGEVARVCGIVIHQIFQRIDQIGWQTWLDRKITAAHRSGWKNRLIENGLPSDRIDEAVVLVERAVIGAKQDPVAKWIFDPAHHDIRVEWPVTGVINNRIQHAIIDRGFIDDQGIRWIIDFKSSRHEQSRDLDAFLAGEKERYRDIMLQYAQIVGSLEKIESRSALYYPVLQRLEKI